MARAFNSCSVEPVLDEPLLSGGSVIMNAEFEILNLDFIHYNMESN
jgi:hypothetical protein